MTTQEIGLYQSNLGWLETFQSTIVILWYCLPGVGRSDYVEHLHFFVLSIRTTPRRTFCIYRISLGEQQTKHPKNMNPPSIVPGEEKGCDALAKPRGRGLGNPHPPPHTNA